MSRIRLSLCMIVRNESRHLRECLSEAGAFVDEMIVVDTGSTDDTAELARAAGARLHSFPWTGDFAAARNESLRHATGDWVLVLDADERVDFLNGSRLLRFLEGADPAVPAFSLRIESEARHSNSGVWLAHYYPRVFRRADGVYFEGALHEQVFGPEGPLCAHAPRLPVVIRHLGYAEPAKELERRQRNLGIIEAEARLRPDDELVQRNLANAYLGDRQWGRAAECFRPLVARGSLDSFVQQASWNLCICELELGNFEAALRALSPGDLSYCAQLLRAEAERRSGNPEAAARILQDLLVMPPDETLGSIDFRAEPVHVRLQLALCERARGFPSLARAQLENALGLNPLCPEVHHELGMLLEAAGDRAAARLHQARTLELNPFFEPAYAALVRLEMVRGDLASARSALARGRQHFPENPDLAALGQQLEQTHQHTSRSRGSWPGLSVAMIVRDGVGSLRRAIESVRAVADEVVIVDTGSKDGSPELARLLGARVVSEAWGDDFSQARNRALTEARGEWILVLDADEVLDPASASALKGLLLQGDWDAAEVEIVNQMRAGEVLSGISHRYCRLFRKLPGVCFEGRVHEQVLPSLIRARARVRPSSLRILHSGYGLSPEVLRAKELRNLRMLRKELEDHPDDGFMLFHLGVTLFALGEMDESTEALERAIRRGPLPPEALSMAHVKLAQAAVATGNFPGARSHLREAASLRPGSPLVQYLQAGVDFAEGRFEASAHALERLLSRRDRPASEEVLDEASVRLDLGNCLYRLERFEEAATSYARAAHLDPRHATARYNLGNARYRCGRYGEALQAFEDALRLAPDLADARENAWQCSLRLAEALAAEGRDAELARLDVEGAPASLKVLVGSAQLRQGRSAEALVLATGAVAADPGDAGASLLLAIALRETGRAEDSLDVFLRLVSGTEADPEVLVQFAATLLETGREAEAARVFAHAVELRPELGEHRAA